MIYTNMCSYNYREILWYGNLFSQKQKQNLLRSNYPDFFLKKEKGCLTLKEINKIQEN